MQDLEGLSWEILVITYLLLLSENIRSQYQEMIGMSHREQRDFASVIMVYYEFSFI